MTLKKINNMDHSISNWFLSYCRIQEYPLNSTFIYQGEQSNKLFYIIQGIVTILKKDEEGKEILVSYLKEGDFFNILNFFNKKKEYDAWFRTKTVCTVATISYKKFLEIYHIKPNLLMYIACQMAKKLKIFYKGVGNLSFFNTQGRIAQVLIDCTKNFKFISRYLSGGTEIKITEKEIAQLVCCSEDIVVRILNIFQNKNLILIKNKCIIIYDSF